MPNYPPNTKPTDTGQSPPTPTIRSSTRRTDTQTQIADEFLNDPAVAALNGTTNPIRGSYSKPTILRFPDELGGSGQQALQYPHVMVFKAFWRWEAKDIRGGLSKARIDTQAKIDSLEKFKYAADYATASPSTALSPMGSFGIPPGAVPGADLTLEGLKTVDPGLYDEVMKNPTAYRQLLEQRIQSEQTRLADLNSFGKVSYDTDETLQVQDRLGEGIQGVDTGTAAAVGAATVAGVSALTAFLLTRNPKVALAAGGIGAVVGGAGAAGLAELAKFAANDPVYDQMVTIVLPFCTRVNNEDSFQFEDTSQTILKGILGALSGGIGTLVESAQQAAVSGAMSQSGALSAAVASGAGLVINPRLEKVFRQKDFRNFTFQWDFYPRNANEVEQVRQIIAAFRYHSHPAKAELGDAEKDANGQPVDQEKVQIMLRVPAEFTVDFMSYKTVQTANGSVQSSLERNQYLPQLGRCAITSIGVDYSPNGVFSTLVDDSPSAITFTLQMSEMGALTREGVEAGF